MKLAKKNGQAVLSFEINGLTRVGRKVRVAHDVKIEVMRPVDVERLREPLCPEPDVRSTSFVGVCVGTHEDGWDVVAYTVATIAEVEDSGGKAETHVRHPCHLCK